MHEERHVLFAAPSEGSTALELNNMFLQDLNLTPPVSRQPTPPSVRFPSTGIPVGDQVRQADSILSPWSYRSGKKG